MKHTKLNIGFRNMKTFFNNVLYTGIREERTTVIHSEIETMEGGRLFTSGDSRLFEHHSKFICFLGIPIWRLEHKVIDKGAYNE